MCQIAVGVRLQVLPTLATLLDPEREDGVEFELRQAYQRKERIQERLAIAISAHAGPVGRV